MGRAFARAKAVDYEGAFEDVYTLLNLDNDDILALGHKALNTYLSCEFEDALIQNIRMAPIRRKPDNFVLGIMTVKD